MKIHGIMKINNKDYVLRYGTNVLQRMEEIDNIHLDKLESDISIGIVAKMLYNGLHRMHPTLTREDVGDLMDDYFEEGGTMQSLAEIIILAINKSLGAKQAKAEVDTEGLQESDSMPK